MVGIGFTSVTAITACTNVTTGTASIISNNDKLLAYDIHEGSFTYKFLKVRNEKKHGYRKKHEMHAQNLSNGISHLIQ